MLSHPTVGYQQIEGLLSHNYLQLPDKFRKGVFNVVQGLGNEVGAALVENSRVKFVSFTGSAATAQKILQAAASRGACE